jgi:hypothetical protein
MDHLFIHEVVNNDSGRSSSPGKAGRRRHSASLPYSRFLPTKRINAGIRKTCQNVNGLLSKQFGTLETSCPKTMILAFSAAGFEYLGFISASDLRSSRSKTSETVR